MAQLCNMGVPMGLQYSITAIGSVILQTAVNGLGSMAVAAVAAATKVNIFFACPFDAMGSTMSTYSGQNLGAGKLDRVRQGVISCYGIGLVYSFLALLVLFLFGDKIALLFINADQGAILANVHLMLKINSAFFAALAAVNIFRFAIQGLGYSKLAILAGVCEMAARAVVGLFLVPAFGFVGACFASPIAWIFADVFLVPAFFVVLKKLRQIQESSLA